MVEQGVREVYVVGDRLHRSQSDVPDVEDEERKEGASCLCLPRSMVPTALTRTTVYDEYTNKSLAMNIVSTILILFDYGSDISVAFWLRKEKDSDFFLLCTIVLILLPLAVVNLFSLVWYSQVLPSPLPPRTTLFTPLGSCLGVTGSGRGRGAWCWWRTWWAWGRWSGGGWEAHDASPRQLQILVLGRREQRHPRRAAGRHPGPSTDRWPTTASLPRADKEYLELYMTRKYYERDAAYLALIDSFTQDAPQLILQLYILLARHPQDLLYLETALSQLGSVLLSLVSLSGALVSYQQVTRVVAIPRPAAAPSQTGPSSLS